MELQETRDGDVLALAASGRLDHETAEGFQKTLGPYLANCSDKGDSIVIDLADVSYVSSVGLRALLVASKQVKASNGKIAVAGMQPTVAEVFRISRFDAILPAYPNVSEAVAALKG